MNGFMIDIFITYNQEFYNETGVYVNRTRQLHYTAFDQTTAEVISQSATHALEDAGCRVIKTAKVLKPAMED